MDSFNDLLPGKLFGADDVKNGPITLTIAGYEAGTLKGQDGEEKANFITFEGTDRRLVVKPALVECLKEIFPSGKSASIGQPVGAYHDPDVKFGGKKVGGLRLRKATGSAAAPF